MSEAHVMQASEQASKPDHSSNVDKDESEPIHSVPRRDRNDDLEEINNKHDMIPIEDVSPVKGELQEHIEEEKSKNDALSPKTTFTDTHQGFHAKNGILHVPTDANDTNETMHTHDINSVYRDPFGSTQRHEVRNIGIGTNDDYEGMPINSGTASKEFATRSHETSPEDKEKRYNYDDRLKEDRMRKLQQRQKELSHKLESLEVQKTAEKTARSVEKIKEEIDKLIPVMVELSPESSKFKKKKNYKPHSEVEKEVYTKDKLKQTHDTIDRIKSEQMEHRNKIKKEIELEKMKEQVKKEAIQKTFDDERERKKAFKKTKLEMTLREINEREKERLKRIEEWKKQSEESKQYHYLYQIKEESWAQYEHNEKSIQQKELEKRANMFKPFEDNLHKKWGTAVQRKRKEIVDNLKARREASISPPRVLENVYHGHFHFLLSKEEEVVKSMNDEKARQVKEFNKKRAQFDEMIKRSIKLKLKKFDPEEDKKQPSAIDLKVQSVKSKQITSHKELYEIGTKNQEEARQLIRKNKSSSNMFATNESSRKTSVPPDSAKSEFASPSKINYLPELKKFLNEKKKKSNLESLMDSDVPDSEKYYLLRAQIEKCDDNTKYIENKLKYGKDRNQMELDKNALDEYNINSLKAKIAILNGLHS